MARLTLTSAARAYFFEFSVSEMHDAASVSGENEAPPMSGDHNVDPFRLASVASGDTASASPLFSGCLQTISGYRFAGLSAAGKLFCRGAPPRGYNSGRTAAVPQPAAPLAAADRLPMPADA